MTFSVLFTFTDFQLIYVLTRGGPVNATHLMATLSYQRGIISGRLGEGAAIAPVPLWRNAAGEVLVEGAPYRRGRVMRLTRALDPQAMPEMRHLYGERDGFALCASPDEALEQADGLIVVTEWKTFLTPDFASMKHKLRGDVIFDGRNIYDPAQVEAAGLAYYGIGRGRSINKAP